MRETNDYLSDGKGRGVNRRDFMRMTMGGVLGAGLAGTSLWALADSASTPLGAKAKAKSVIQLALWGGMTQFETFDPKPKAAPEFRSAFKAIPTNVPGIEICELLPKLAKMADKYAILRALMNPRTGHGEAGYVMVANAPYPADVVSKHPAGELVYPAVGAIVGMKKTEDGTYKGEIPPWVCVSKPPYGVNEGFLGPKHKAFCTRPLSRAAVSKGQTEKLKERQGLLNVLQPGAGKDDTRQAARDASGLREEVFRSMTSSAREVFNLAEEPEAVKSAYGDHAFGRACLLARRLVEYGVPFVSIPWSSIRTPEGKQYGWDMHTELNASVKALCPVLDQTFSTLLTDLSDRGLLDSTVVTLFAENGKGPHFSKEDKGTGKPNGTRSGRAHWGKGYSVVVAGGGFQGGKVVGEMDKNGQTLVSRPVYPWDMWESIYMLLGINPKDKLPNPYGCVAYVSQADACNLPRGGILTEIM